MNNILNVHQEMPVFEAKPSIGVIIPCYNAATTLTASVESALAQVAVNAVWIVDDASTDNSFAIAQTLAAKMPNKIKLLRMPTNSGAALARNWAAMLVQEPLLAFLDADDVYQPFALDAAAQAFKFIPELSVVRLALHPWGVPQRFTAQTEFEKAWRSVEMTIAGNLVIARSVFLAVGGFPKDALFKKHGGEDAALGIALHDSLMVGTLFDQPGVRYRYSNGSHCERLLNAYLFGKAPTNSPSSAIYSDIDEANAVTARIKGALKSLRAKFGQGEGRVVPLVVEEASV